MSAARRQLGVAAQAAKAVTRFKRSLFEDPISLQSVGRSRGVTLNKQTYDARSLRTIADCT